MNRSKYDYFWMRQINILMMYQIFLINDSVISINKIFASIKRKIIAKQTRREIL